MYNKKFFIFIYTILFVLGIFFILGSDIYNLGSAISMRYAGIIISLVSGIGFLLEIYFPNKNKWIKKQE